MSRMNQQTHWDDFPNHRLPTIASLNQPMDVWMSSGALLPELQPVYSDVPQAVSLPTPSNAVQAQDVRLDTATSGGAMPIARPQESVPLQPPCRSEPIIAREHGGSSHSLLDRGRVDNTSSKRPSRKPKAPPLGESQWEQRKPYIEQLYMQEDLPLSEVIRRMEETHKFFATERMYKNKFKAWRWSKNTPAAWMAKKARQRKLDGKDTVFYWNNQRWTSDELAQRNGKVWQNQSGDGTMIICGRTPNDTKYYTPGNESPQLGFISHQPHGSNERNQGETFYLDTPPVNLEYHKTTLSQLHDLLKEASCAASTGKVNDADADFRDSVSGFRFKLSPTHDETIRAAYMYACFYAKTNQMDKADAVLNWMSNHHVKKWGSSHDNTYLHYARTIELFQSWGRQEDAEVLVYRLLDDQMGEGVNLLDIGHEPYVQRASACAHFDKSFPDTDDPEQISQQLSKINLAIMSNIKGLNNVLEVIIEHCDQKPLDLNMSLQACRAKCTLATWHNNDGDRGLALNILKGARRSITPFIIVEEQPMSRATIQTAKTLAYQFLEMREDSCSNAVLEDVVGSLNSRCQTFDCDDNDKAFLLDFVLTVAFRLHEVASWDKCRYWVERGLGLAMKLHGLKSPEARRFQKILDKEDFDMRSSISVHDLMKASGGLFNIRLVSNSGFL
ncbi:hypothetical protein FVEN_g4529 [Fusarium venenatum]|uniref:Clr5 domain-containing protein n=1 Tax=Fusarium venenatum TaxID=56646 RepID=A0A2L2T8F8_9HYPO|nr:uncharacterized protein FVRRES_02571 [Fusarium venenatum]KAG8357919.1 hypothetical protein FVEN_g4529 [Fusarium venenatum]KAH7004333.1 hypothetical protein EDB82DRAFT_46334 [Fusarium venenatum]CEI66059.1 unnamed protein product [Fusarium venenatum]